MDPWDNDSAADWFAEVWGDGFVDRVIATLNDPDEGEPVVAALWLVSELCRVYVWPIDRYRETLTAGIAAADRILAGEDAEGLVEMWDDADFNAQIERLREVLVARSQVGSADD